MSVGQTQLTVKMPDKSVHVAIGETECIALLTRLRDQLPDDDAELEILSEYVINE